MSLNSSSMGFKRTLAQTAMHSLSDLSVHVDLSNLVKIFIL